MKKVGIGLIGCGGRLRYLLRHLLKHSDSINIVSLYDPDKRSVRAVHEEFGSHLTACDSYSEVINNPNVDWVMIASWNSYHRQHAVAAFEAGKNVFCEKPLATTMEDCLAMRDAWRKSGKKFVIGFTLRYSPHYHKIKQLIDAGEIGYVISAEFNETLDFNHGGYIHRDWRRLTKNAGTHLLEKHCHDIDITNWLFGSKAKRVASFGGCNFFIPENNKYIARFGKDENGRDAYMFPPSLDDGIGTTPFTADKDIVDNQVAIIEYENNVRATFHTNCNAGIVERRMYIIGSEGAIRADVLTGEIQLKKIGFHEDVKRYDTGAKGEHGDGDDVLAKNLVDCMCKDAEPITSLLDGMNSAITCFAIDEAMSSGTVVDLANWWEKV